MLGKSALFLQKFSAWFGIFYLFVFFYTIILPLAVAAERLAHETLHPLKNTLPTQERGTLWQDATNDRMLKEGYEILRHTEEGITVKVGAVRFTMGHLVSPPQENRGVVAP